MSAQKRRNVLVIFGVVAIALIGAVVYVAPNFRTEDASGAIGAVEKHRAPQVAKSDVVLGSEAVKQQQQVVYADFLNDAAKLHNVGAKLNVKALSAEDAQLAVQSLQQMNAELANRYLESAEAALAAASALDNKHALANMDEAALANKAKLGNEAMAELANQFLAAANSLASKDALANKGLESFDAALANKDQLASVAALNNAIEAEQLANKLRVHAEYLAVAAAESKALDNAIAQLEAASLESQSLNVAKGLEMAAAELESHAIDNMQDFLANEEAFLASVAAVENKLKMAAALDSRKQNLGAAYAEMQNRSAELANQAELAVQSQLAMAAEYLSNRSQLGVEAANRSSLESFSAQLDQMSEAMANKARLGNALPNASKLALQAEQLANRASMMARTK